VLVMEDPRADYGVFNVGGGRAVTVSEFAELMLRAAGSRLLAEVSGEYRLGDTRHTISDISRLRCLGWQPEIPVEQNVDEYLAWIGAFKGTREYLEQAESLMHAQNVVRRVNPPDSGRVYPPDSGRVKGS
jgi:dTDP-L-rhamnose 4-epimerase